VVGFGGPEFGQFFELGDYGSRPVLLVALYGLFGCRQLLIASVEYGRAVASAYVVALPVYGRRVVYAKEIV
jgi:hypothetical protein